MKQVIKCDYCGKEFEVYQDMVKTDLVRKMVWCPYCDKELYLNLYICDPEKNKDCKKSFCKQNGGFCFCTWQEQYAAYPTRTIESHKAYEIAERMQDGTGI